MKISRGDIWLVNLNPTLGSEISKTRPVLILSHSAYNQMAETVTVVPISTGRYIRSFHVSLKDLKKESHAIIPQMRVASKAGFIKKLARASELELDELKQKMLRYLDMR